MKFNMGSNTDESGCSRNETVKMDNWSDKKRQKKERGDRLSGSVKQKRQENKLRWFGRVKRVSEDKT